MTLDHWCVLGTSHCRCVNVSVQVSIHLLLSIFLHDCQTMVVVSFAEGPPYHLPPRLLPCTRALSFNQPHFLTTANMEGIVTIMGLKPETRYSVRLAALNGKGLGEISAATEFKTQPVRKYNQLLCLSPNSHSSILSSGTHRDPELPPVVARKIAFDSLVPVFLVAHSTLWFSGMADLPSLFSKCV